MPKYNRIGAIMKRICVECRSRLAEPDSLYCSECEQYHPPLQPGGLSNPPMCRLCREPAEVAGYCTDCYEAYVVDALMDRDDFAVMKEQEYQEGNNATARSE